MTTESVQIILSEPIGSQIVLQGLIETRVGAPKTNTFATMNILYLEPGILEHWTPGAIPSE